MNRLLLILLVLFAGTLSTLQSAHVSAVLFTPYELSADSDELPQDSSPAEHYAAGKETALVEVSIARLVFPDEHWSTSAPAQRLNPIRAPPISR